MRPQLVRAVLLAHELQHRANVTFWLECGSMLGGSLIRTAHVARKLERYDGLSLVAIDPFTGDVNMWAGEARAIATNARFRFLGLRNGQLIWDTGYGGYGIRETGDGIMGCRIRDKGRQAG